MVNVVLLTHSELPTISFPWECSLYLGSSFSLWRETRNHSFCETPEFKDLAHFLTLSGRSKVSCFCNQMKIFKNEIPLPS